MPDVNITINVGEEPKVTIDKSPPIKRKTRKLPNGRETILEIPNTVETTDNRNILDLMGV